MNTKYKKILILAAMAVATSSFAANEQNFDIQAAKTKAKDRLNKEIKVLESAKTCVDSATNKAEFDACKAKAKIDLQAARKEK